MTLTYDDLRYGDRYEVYLNPNGTFSHATRHLDKIGRDALHYDTLETIPSPHREAIEHLIWEKLNPTRR